MPHPYIKINLADRLNPTTTTPSQFTIGSNVPISGLDLKAIYLPITYYNISTLNNAIYFTDTVARVGLIAVGYYSSGSTFISAVLTAMNNASGGAGTYTCTLNALTKAITVSCNIPFAFTFSQTISTAAELMGYKNANTIVATSQLATATLNLSTSLCYNISINNASGTTSLSSASTSFVIPALTTTPSEMYYEVPLNIPQRITFQTTKYLDISR